MQLLVVFLVLLTNRLISSGGIMHMASAAYGIGKAAKDRMAQDFNKELDGTGRDLTNRWFIV